MNKKKEQNLSTFMSKILRHSPLEFGIILDGEGFCTVEELLLGIQSQSYWRETTTVDILQVVQNCSKQRYEVKEGKIRARYGHSTMKPNYPIGTPPDILYHGTSKGSLDSIFEKGILNMNRQDVHLSETTHFASLAGKRHGKLTILVVDTKKAMEKGVNFRFAGNEVWLSNPIPVGCFSIL